MDFYKELILILKNGHLLYMVSMEIFQIFKLVELGYGEELKFHNI